MRTTTSSARDVVQTAIAKLRGDRKLLQSQRDADVGIYDVDDVDSVDIEPDVVESKADGRYEAMTRIMLVIELVAPLRYGATVAMVHPDVCNEYGKVDRRTVYRDLKFLESLGLLDREGDRYVWRDGNFRSILHRETARSWRKAAAARKSISTVAAIRQHAEDEGWTDSDTELEIGWPESTEEELTSR